MPTTRQERVAHQLRQIAGDIILKELRDPYLGFVTVTDVRVSPDLREAQIFVSVLGDEERQAEGMKALKRATPYVRRQLARRAGLRNVPEIRFLQDTAIEHGSRIFELLEEVKKEEEAHAPREDEGD